MDNFRRRSSAKKQRTVVSTSYVVDRFKATDINITNGIFRINTSAGSTANLSITITYTATTHLKTVYSDGTVENSNTTTSSGTCTLTEAKMIDDFIFFGTYLNIAKTIELGNGCILEVYLAVEEWNKNIAPIPLPEQSGDEKTDNLFVNGDFDPMFNNLVIHVYIANTGTLYYVNLSVRNVL